MSADALLAGQHLLLSFYKALDEARFSDAATAFATNGEWHRKGEVLRGPDQVARAFDGRDPDLRTRHVVSNILLNPSEGGQEFSLYITLFATNASSDAVPTISGPAMVLTSNGTLINQAGHWKIRTKQTTRQFRIKPANN